MCFHKCLQISNVKLTKQFLNLSSRQLKIIMRRQWMFSVCGLTDLIKGKVINNGISWL